MVSSLCYTKSCKIKDQLSVIARVDKVLTKQSSFFIHGLPRRFAARNDEESVSLYDKFKNESYFSNLTLYLLKDLITSKGRPN